MVDVFEQVEEELRSDRYKRLARTWLPVAGVVLVVALVAALGWWGWDSLNSSKAAKAAESAGLRWYDEEEDKNFCTPALLKVYRAIRDIRRAAE